MPLYYKNNVPRVSFRMIKLLVGLCGAKTETLAVVRDFTFFTGTPKGSFFLQSLAIQIVDFPNFYRIVELQK